MGKKDDLSHLTKELHQLFVWFTKQCLAERPKNVQKYCLEKLALKLGHRVIEGAPSLSREVSLLQKDNVTEFMNDIKLVKQETKLVKTSTNQQHKRGYLSTDDDEDDEDAIVIESNTTSTATSATTNTTTTSTAAAAVAAAAAITPSSTATAGANMHSRDRKEHAVRTNSDDKSAATVTYLDDDDEESEDDDHDDHADDRKHIEFFTCETFRSEELDKSVQSYVKDKRMIQLFDEWDSDNSGAVDFVELVIALHKFEQVAAAGVDIKVAADALVQFVESDTERELKLPQFTRVIIVFARNLFEKSFDDVADHMLKVATSTSEAAVLHAASGKDVSDIVAIDREELQLMRETAECVSVNVQNNISRLRTLRGGVGGNGTSNAK